MPGCRPVHAAKNVQHGGFAGPRGSHDGDEFSTIYVEAHSAQCMHGFGSHFEIATKVLNRKYGCFGLHKDLVSCLLDALTR